MTGSGSLGKRVKVLRSTQQKARFGSFVQRPALKWIRPILTTLGPHRIGATSQHQIYKCGAMFYTNMGQMLWPLLPFSSIFRGLAMTFDGCPAQCCRNVWLLNLRESCPVRHSSMSTPKSDLVCSLQNWCVQKYQCKVLPHFWYNCFMLQHHEK